MKTQIKVGNVGALTNGVHGLWRVLAVDGDTAFLNCRLTFENIETQEQTTETVEFFWPLLDSFAP